MPPAGNILLSVVSPVYRAEAILPKLVEQITASCSAITGDFEIILVEDGSSDNSWQVIEGLCRQDRRVKGIKLSRNFGQHYAITAGLEASQGEFVVVIDCDLQDNPKYIADLYQKAKEGYDIVYTRKQSRQHSFFKNLFARFFFFIFNWLSDSQQATSDVGAYSLLSRKAVDAFCRIKDSHRHYLMIVRTLGFKNTSITVIHEKRLAGKTSYSFNKLLKHAINGITSQSDKLLRLSITVGLVYFFISILAATLLIIEYFVQGFKEGWASTIVLLLFSTGIILMSIGIAGIYIGKIFEQVKDRPLYIIDRKINFNE